MEDARPADARVVVERRSPDPQLKVLYLTHNGIGTPLVRSQVLPYLRGLLERGYDVHLVTFERGERFPEGEFPAARWHPVRPRSGSHLLAKLIDVLVGIVLVHRLVRREHVDILHARSYLPAAIAWLVSRLTGRPYIFDMRGFLPDEYLEGGHWSARDLRYRVLRLVEARLFRGAAVIVSLTRAGERRLRTERRYARWVADTRIAVIPCAVDLERFRPLERSPGAPTLVYAGSLGMWYLLDEMLHVYAYARELVPALRFLILNRTEHAVAAAAIARAGLGDASITLAAADFGEMPTHLASADVAIALLRQVPSKIGSSPIKIGEYLACGLPVIVNAGLGDTDELVLRYAAGHVVRSFSDPELRRAGVQLAALIGDGVAGRNARRAAEETLDLRLGIDAYAAVYESLRSPPAGRFSGRI
ncbi:MAG: glycosyltransferase [Chloroflexi bacterium]|nr:glycosyltransferase [Chloroflexota bacterium]